MKKSFLVFIGLLLAGCSEKERLAGTREDVILTDEQKDVRDTSPVVIEKSQMNTNFTQIACATDYAPLAFSKDPHLLWSADLDFEASESAPVISSAVAAEGKVFCLDAAGIVYAFNAETGEKIWRMSTILEGKDTQTGGALAYDDGKLLVTSCFAEAFALNAQTGDIIWRVKLPSACKGDGITVSGGKAYLLCDNSSLQVLDVKNGNTLWSHSGMLAESTFIGSAGVAVKDGAVYLAYPSGEVYALLENGSVLWSAMLSKFSFVNTSQSFSHPRACPVVKDNLVYFINASQRITAFDIGSGNEVWRREVGGIQTPVVSGNSIFILNSDSELMCLNKDTGATKWACSLVTGRENSTEWFGPLLTDSGLFAVSALGDLVRISPVDGRMLYTSRLENAADGVNVRPIIANRTMYLPMDCGKLVAYK